ncbi:hypothetical protein A2994_03125 [candidate division Kazan bacterium RIFCSPLOWO2_01_FULL_48_13]|uniref:Glycosyltransferase RgtA/B/C/D-like domain-containing protein n=1 Tax=candidate division Kazan bacterium RIFCSPLOWO2_01_FULL_48_13 TaxID=1798539 RepID=A0A1F4PPW4_UNCK3|nr:MAG: hypothetical protein A2994_03125 [candidate division Kazan bacterium RIFCSPLOWO2_01_FULL_48_13]
MTALDRLGLLLLVGLGLRPILDPDFGWHLRSGTDLLNYLAVPRTDPYSHTLPDWPWVNHEWLSDVVVAFTHNHLSSLVVIILFTILITTIFLLAASVEPVGWPYKILAAVVGLLAALPILGVRMQMITLLGMAWLIWILYRHRRGDLKNLWWLPIAFLLWANLHGGFVIGLVILVVWWLCEGAKYLILHWRPVWYSKLQITELALDRSQLRHLFGISWLAGIATLINPYGWGLYADFYKLFTNPFAIQHISEWQPVSLDNALSLNFTLYLILFGLVLLMTYRKIEPTRWIMSGLFLYLSLLYWRNMPFFMIISVGFLAEILQQHTHLIIRSLSKNKWVLTGAVIIISIIIGQRIDDVAGKLINPTASLRSGGYPIDAVQWAKANPDKIGKTMFNEYDWGGFLIWQFPEQKVFVDGRMPYWKTSNRFPFLEEQYAISAQSGSIEMLENTYGVDWIMIRPGRQLALVLSGQKDWKLVYHDTIAMIYYRIDGSDKNNT